MLKVTAKVVFDHIPQITAAMRPRASLAVQKTLLDIERMAKESMQGPKSGRLYERADKPHQASAPGEAPAIDLGLLVGSIQTRMEGDISGMVFTNIDYAQSLEFGSIRMAARPFFTPAAVEAWPGFVAAMKEVISDV